MLLIPDVPVKVHALTSLDVPAAFPNLSRDVIMHSLDPSTFVAALQYIVLCNGEIMLLVICY